MKAHFDTGMHVILCSWSKVTYLSVLETYQYCYVSNHVSTYNAIKAYRSGGKDSIPVYAQANVMLRQFYHREMSIRYPTDMRLDGPQGTDVVVTTEVHVVVSLLRSW